MKVPSYTIPIGSLAVAILLSACNVFSPFDGPSGDAQLLSAARACLDNGNFQCAADDYSKLSPSLSDTAASESAFAILDQYGASFGNFATAFGKTSVNAGQSITQLASFMIPQAGLAAREAVFTAFQKAISPPISNVPLRGLVRFVAGTAFIAELLAEDAAAGGTLFKDSDLVTNPTACFAIANVAACKATATNNPCSVPSGKHMVEGPSLANSLNDVTMDQVKNGAAGNPTLYMINAAITAVNDALTNELGSASNLGSSSSSFATAITALAPLTLSSDPTNTQDSPCFRYALIIQNVGKNP